MARLTKTKGRNSSVFSLAKANICKKSTASNGRTFFVARRVWLLFQLALTGCAEIKAKLPMIFPPSPVVRRAPAPPPVYHTADGLKITPLDVPLDENARILGIQKWRFSITPPPLATYLQYRLYWEESGHPPKRLMDTAHYLDNTQKRDVVAAMQPNQDYLSDSPKLRLYFGDASSSGTSLVENPMRRAGGGSVPGVDYSQRFRKDGSCVLLEVGNRFPSLQNPRLVLRMKALKNKSGLDMANP